MTVTIQGSRAHKNGWLESPATRSYALLRAIIAMDNNYEQHSIVLPGTVPLESRGRGSDLRMVIPQS